MGQRTLAELDSRPAGGISPVRYRGVAALFTGLMCLAPSVALAGGPLWAMAYALLLLAVEVSFLRRSPAWRRRDHWNVRRVSSVMMMAAVSVCLFSIGTLLLDKGENWGPGVCAIAVFLFIERTVPFSWVEGGRSAR